MAEVVETVAEGIEAVADELDDVAEVTRGLTGQDMRLLVGGLLIGFAAGYNFAKKRLATKYDTMTADAMDKMREHYREKEQELNAEIEKIRTGPKPPIEKVMQDLGYDSAVTDPNPTRYSEIEQNAINEVEEAHKPEVQNVFEEAERNPAPVQTWDYATEVKSRVPHLPYVIHFDEFTQNEDDYEQVSYVWYEQDQILADSADVAIENFEQMVGLENIKFGHGSNDPNVVYVRNDKMHLDIEVVRNGGSYGEEVHGVIRHSSQRHIRTSRKFDDDE